MSKVESMFLPQFSIGEDVFDKFRDELLPFGNRAAVFYGEKAWRSAEKYVLPALQSAGIELCCAALYGHDATYENAERMIQRLERTEVDMILAVGGGKCIDTVKLVADRLNKPVFTIPTIASNCAPVTMISIMYHQDGSFKDIPRLKHPPRHCFIHSGLILEAPVRFLWAGMGDAMAKHIESSWSAKNDSELSYGSQLGINVGSLCYRPILRYGKIALESAGAGKVCRELEEVLLDVIVSPGIVSVSVHPHYNGGVAHALFYGLTRRKHIEENHLHGEVVSYGSLVNLMLDADRLRLAETWRFNQSIGLPLRLADLELEAGDRLEDVLELTMQNQELSHTPYPVSKEKIFNAIMELEHYSA